MTPKATMQKLRFAPIIRVSTESQEKQGESLNTQKKQVTSSVEMIGGDIPDHCWKYSGQEHATPEQERTRLDQLLQDSDKGLFEAVIVCDISRWSRDNLKSKQGLNILKQNGIRFFVGTVEYDLFNPEQSFFLTMGTAMAEMQADQQAQKSIINRIERAKQGIPTSGKLPYGRTWSKKDGWGIDKEKQEIIERLARRYLKGEKMADLSKEYGMNHASLWKTLTQRSGTEWPCRFTNKRLNIDETVMMEIPPLLDEKTIAAIKEKAEANKTYQHGHIKYRYLLSRMIFCGHCGMSFVGTPNSRGIQYYRHNPRSGCDRFHQSLRADKLDNLVLTELVRSLGDPKRMEEAVRKATPNTERIEAHKKELTDVKSDIKKAEEKKNRIVSAIAEGIVLLDEAKQELDKLRDQLSLLNSRKDRIEKELNHIPNPTRIKQLTKFGKKVLIDAIRNNPAYGLRKKWEWKRGFVERVFGGKDAKSQRMGVYVFLTGDEKQPIRVELRGYLEKIALDLPVDDDYLIDLFKIDPEDPEYEKKLDKARSVLY